MKIAVISEVSAMERNQAVMDALSKTGHEVFNVGMRADKQMDALSYIHTGFLAGLLLNTGAVDFVVGGCGTGEGFMISANQYPGVFCGLIRTPLEAWLFAQINGGNCISLPLLFEYGWAGDVNLEFLFEKLFAVEFGCGYPEHRREPQRMSREMLKSVSEVTHRPFAEIIKALPQEVVKAAFAVEGLKDILPLEKLRAENLALLEAINEYI